MSKQLGYVPDEEENATGESLRDKAVMMSKNWRSVKFFLQNGAKLMNGLRVKEHTKALAKEVPKDIRMVISGEKDIGEIMEKYSDVINNHLSNDRPLLAKINEIMMNNETDIVLNSTSMFENQFAIEEEDPDNPSFNPPSSTDFMDIFDMLESGGDEMKELLESAYFRYEDYVSRVYSRNLAWQHEHAEALHREKTLKKNMEDLQMTIIEKNEVLRSNKHTETVLNKQLEDYQSKIKSEISHFQDVVKDCNKKISNLEVKLSDSESSLHMKSQELLIKDLENEKLKNQVELLNNELMNTQQSKKSIEDDSNRQRNDMRHQMERLRQNMHELLVQGGEEAKVIESHNVTLQNEIDTLRDNITNLYDVKNRLEMENNQLRSQFNNTLEEIKVQYNTCTVLKEEVRPKETLFLFTLVLTGLFSSLLRIVTFQ
jgi:predicted  nucleic acid-binding Zn-ribbon protein